MSIFQHPVGQDGQTRGLSQSHDSITMSATMTDHQPNSAPCPYEDKIVADPTKARVLLMFLREFVETQSIYTPWAQACFCPMMKCFQAFVEPLGLIQHLLSCPELGRGEFNCWKCHDSHEFPTTEKDWAEWSGWKCNQHVVDCQPKQSLGSKMKRTFSRRHHRASSKSGPQVVQKDGDAVGSPWNVHPQPGLPYSLEQHVHQMPDAQPSLSFGLDQRAQQQQQDQIDMSAFSDGRKASGQAPPDLHVGQIPWHEMMAAADVEMSDATPNTPSTTVGHQTHSQASSSKTSSSTFVPSLIHDHQFGPNLVPQDGSAFSPQQYCLSPQSAVSSGPSAFGCHCLSPLHGLAVEDLFISSPVNLQVTGPEAFGGIPTTMAPQTPAAFSGYLDHMQTIDMDPTSQPPQVHQQLMPCHPMGQGPVQPSPTLCGSDHVDMASVPGGVQLQLQPHDDDDDDDDDCSNHHHHHNHDGEHDESRQSTPDRDMVSPELICDECQWQPRGVKENLKGYLRKHKNNHKGLRFPCEHDGCKKTFSRLDNLKKHIKDKHENGDAVSMPPPPPPMHTAASMAPKTISAEVVEVEQMQQQAGAPHDGTTLKRRRDSGESGFRGVLPQHAMLWHSL